MSESEQSEDAEMSRKKAQCSHFLNYVLSDRKIEHLLNSLSVYGCTVTERDFFRCVEQAIPNDARFYADDPSSVRIDISIHSDWTVGMMQRRLRHELVRAYDWCRTEPGVSSSQNSVDECGLLACSEIRAARLSSECHPRWMSEETGTSVTMAKKRAKSQSGEGLRCIRKRAAQRVNEYPQCFSADGSGLRAWQSVNQVWSVCFRDTDPFSDRSDAW